MISAKCRVLVVNRNVTLILVLPGLAMIWAAQIQTVALPMFVVAVVIVVATKELIMCLSDSVSARLPSNIRGTGYIEINGLRSFWTTTATLPCPTSPPAAA
ncbi:hypothetical protein [Neisseria yangbaofengii]|uniref:hypothetical protein n=1 Tax=Neisseria yangbaofengii TaxID=2709396 RepID=UPI0013EC9680|nr:hypothetical protein [Neisseria yangbaofengii]